MIEYFNDLTEFLDSFRLILDIDEFRNNENILWLNRTYLRLDDIDYFEKTTTEIKKIAR